MKIREFFDNFILILLYFGKLLPKCLFILFNDLSIHLISKQLSVIGLGVQEFGVHYDMLESFPNGRGGADYVKKQDGGWKVYCEELDDQDCLVGDLSVEE